MACIHEPHPDAVAQLDIHPVRFTMQVRNCFQRICHRIQGDVFLFPQTFALTVSPLRLKLLNMSAVAKHDAAEICSCLCRVDISAESFRIQFRNQTGMINMRVCQQHKIQVCGRNRNRLIFKAVDALFHSVVYQKTEACRLDVITAACHLMCCT